LNSKIIIPSDIKRRPQIYYGFIVLAACFFIMTLVYGAQGSFGVFFKPMLNEFGWTRAETSGPFALNMVFSGILSIFAGRLSDRFGPRKVVLFGCLIISLGYLLSFGINHLWQFYLYFGVVVAAGQSSIYVSVISILVRWFAARRGLMSSIGISGLSFGVGVVPIISSQLIESFSWRTSFLILGVICLVLLLLFAQFLRDNPELSTLPDKDRQKIASNRDWEFSFHEAFKTRQFWMLCIAWVFYGVIAQVGVVHIVPYASILSAIGIVGIFGRIGTGFIADRFSTKATIYSSCFLMAVSFLGLVVSSSVGMLYVFAVIFGLLFGIGALVGPIVGEYFGLKGIGAISGSMIFAYSIGGAIGPLLAGRIFDAAGSYQIAFLACGISGIASGLFIWLIKPLSK
jgi:MFS family permease